MNQLTVPSINNIQITSEIITVTPEIAKEWLENKNLDSNRNISEPRAKHYANIMLAGQWIIGDALKFDMEDVLCDGQHRLYAVCLANIPINFLVLKGFERKSAQAFDRGFNRNLANIAQLQGHEWIKPVHTSIFNGLFFYQSTEIGYEKFTPNQKIEAIAKLKESFSTALYKSYRGCQVGKNISSSSIHSLIVRAFYSPDSSTYLYKSIKKPFTSDILKDFLNLVYGFNYVTDPELFSQSILDPSAPIRLRDAFFNNTFKLSSHGSVAKQKYMYAQTALFKYLSNKKIRNLSVLDQNLFPVSWIDDLSFNKPQ